jgi:plastocyanin
MRTLLMVGALVAASCTADLGPSGDVGYGEADNPDLRVVALDNYFEPDVVEAPAGEEITIEVPNEGRVLHDFVIDELGINTGLIDAGRTAWATFIVPEGTTEFVCTLHRGMTGTIESE